MFVAATCRTRLDACERDHELPRSIGSLLPQSHQRLRLFPPSYPHHTSPHCLAAPPPHHQPCSYVEAGPEPAFGDVEQWTNLPLEPDVGAVLVAFDEHFSYMKLIKACCYLARPGCLFLATNRDHAELVAPGRVLPVTGSLLAAVETGAARQATVLGKPSPFILRCIAATSPGGALDPARTLIVGDRLDMDVAFGNACGLRSVLALSGVSSLEDARGCLAEPARRHHVPDFYIESVADLLGAAQIRANPGAGSGEGEDDDSDGGV
ncbi:glycerol-3-phosphate phosphatase-like [Lampetra fluviatilis]